MTDPCSGRGFTLVEVLVSVGVLALLGTGLMILYRNSMLSYRITSWKQERTRQAELFWNHLRKPLEEASDLLQRQDLGGGRWTITKTSRPLEFHPAGGEGKFMAWQVDHYNPATGLVEGPLTFRLIRDRGRILMPFLPGPNKTVLEDVAQINIRATQITQANNTFAEELDLSGTSPDAIVGSILEISIILAPPPGANAPDIKLVQNAKFKLVVEARPTPTPSY